MLRALRDISLIAVIGILYMVADVLGNYRSGVPLSGLVLTLQYIWVGWNTGFLTGVLGLDHPFTGRVVLANVLAPGHCCRGGCAQSPDSDALDQLRGLFHYHNRGHRDEPRHDLSPPIGRNAALLRGHIMLFRCLFTGVLHQ
ncbi:MAG: hypothetical protein WDN04_10270 [Rhodospirillales bacterium]